MIQDTLMTWPEWEKQFEKNLSEIVRKRKHKLAKHSLQNEEQIEKDRIFYEEGRDPNAVD